MPLICDELSSETVTALYAKIQKLPEGHLLRKDAVDGNLVVYKDGECAIFHSSAGFYFRRIRHDLESEIMADIRENRDYLCSAFEVDRDDPSVVQKLRERFQESHGHKMARMIDDHVMMHSEKQIMLVKFPSCVLRHMLTTSGGVLKTGFSGLRSNLAQIPTLVRFGQIPDDEEHAFVKSMIVTQYKDHQYLAAQRVHYDILREVIARPNIGITLNPVSLWDS